MPIEQQHVSNVSVRQPQVKTALNLSKPTLVADNKEARDVKKRRIINYALGATALATIIIGGICYARRSKKPDVVEDLAQNGQNKVEDLMQKAQSAIKKEEKNVDNIGENIGENSTKILQKEPTVKPENAQIISDEIIKDKKVFENGKCIQELHFYDDGKTLRNTRYFENEKPLKDISYWEDGISPKNQVDFKNGYMVQNTEFYPDGKSFERVQVFAEKNNPDIQLMLREINYKKTPEGSIKESEAIYDSSRGRFIRRDFFAEDGITVIRSEN